MSTIRWFAGPTSKRTGNAKVVLLLTHKRVLKKVETDLWVDAKNFDFITWLPTKKHEDYAVVIDTMAEKIKIARKVLIEDVPKRHYTAEALKEHIERKLKRGSGPVTLTKMAQGLYSEMMEDKRTGDAEHLLSVINALTKWLDKREYGKLSGESKKKIIIESDFMLIDLDVQKIKQYKKYLQNHANNGNGVKDATIISYFTKIRNVFLYAIGQKEFPKDLNPFAEEKLFPKQPSGGKEHEYSVKHIADLERIAPTLPRSLQLIADTLLLSFYMNGQDFGDVVLRVKTEMFQRGKDFYISFRRIKNARFKDETPLITVKLIPKAMAIIDKYNHPELLIPVLNGFPLDKDGKICRTGQWYKRYRTRYRYFLRYAHSISKLIDSPKLKGKMGRYLWGTVSENEGISDTTQKRGMGHTIKGQTGKYANPKQFSPEREKIQQRVDKANAIVQDTVNKINFNPEMN